ncbi:MAG: AMMECR1 domain-containing protein [Candidatus Adiutrix sp.]
MTFLAKTLALAILCFHLWAYGAESWAQQLVPSPPILTGPQQNVLLLIAREAIDATLENRQEREPTVASRLRAVQPLVISIYVNNQLRKRTWALIPQGPLFSEVSFLTFEAIHNSKISSPPLTVRELAEAQISVAILTNFKPAKDDSEVAPDEAVIIYNGFTEWVGLSGDGGSNNATDLLRHTSRQAGLRPNAWLLPQTTIFSATSHEFRETRF